jgi:N-acyl homoserine lactone hydrolase
MEPAYRILLPGVPVSSRRGALGWCNVVLLRRGGRNILFDTGSYGDRRQLLDALAARGLAPADVDLVFVSHFHYDHAANAEIFPCDVAVSERERRYAVDEEFLSARDPFVPRALVPYLAQRLVAVRSGDEVARGVVAVELPGHTPGTMGLLLRDEGVLLSGDAVKNAWDLVHDEPPPCFAAPELALESYRRVREVAATVVPGHDRPFRLIEGGVRYEEEWSVEIEVYADPSREPERVSLLAAEACADAR